MRQQDFTYDAEQDVYARPRSTLLCFWGNNYVTQVGIYQPPTEDCQACAIRSQCANSTEGRKLNRHFAEEYRARVRGYHTTAAYWALVTVTVTAVPFVDGPPAVRPLQRLLQRDRDGGDPPTAAEAGAGSVPPGAHRGGVAQLARAAAGLEFGGSGAE